MVDALWSYDQCIFFWEKNMSMTDENKRNVKTDKNLQDDWIPDQQRRGGATSEAITEYGGDLKRKESIIEKEDHKSSLEDSDNWKKKK